MSERRRAIEGETVLLAGAQASVTLSRLSTLLDCTARHLVDRRESYDRQFERVDGTDGVSYYLTESAHWDTVGARLEFEDRETDAVRRTHETQFERDGRRMGRTEEFETTLEIRGVVAMPSRLSL
jgi:hypothetical protein